ncbi:hypothetical protein BBO_03928 [Beauveria brongniartii RCEF 3172]|uniref:Uncharacterized protein n=1 Tax=Beauveria brongniartii RCEF 3172 TaxID=1081107 RepID=A0A162LVB3_9HYPO|nr:hypothetical protein BBO_03928 [Beauveria brongniartii RCEF 3172]
MIEAMEVETAHTTTKCNSFLVHPFTTEPGAQNQCTLPPHYRLPQFSTASSHILSRINGNDVAPQENGGGGQSDTSKIDDEFTLLLPDSSYTSSSAPPVEYVYANDDSFETAGVEFDQQSIPFRPPYEPIEEVDAAADAPAAPNREETIEAQRQAWLRTLPEGVRPAKPELFGFSAGPEALASALTSYFYNKPKTDLLNILSFCDQLEPQLLVDLLVSVSKRHPKLPLLDAPDWQERVLAQEAARAGAAQMRAKAHQRPRHGHTLLNPRMRQKRKRMRKVLEISATATDAAAAGKAVVLQEVESEDEELLPPTWPGAGEGLYAALPPENQDTLYLADEGDDDSFSHFMVDGLGNLTALVACR